MDVFSDAYLQHSSPFGSVGESQGSTTDAVPGVQVLHRIWSLHLIIFLYASQEHKTMSRGGGVVIGSGKRNPNEKQKTRKGKRNK